jgi:hypothetical protein
LWLFLFLAFVILTITCAEIAIVMCYFQLCSEVCCNEWRLPARLLPLNRLAGLPLVVAQLPDGWRERWLHVHLLHLLLSHAAEHHRLCQQAALLWLQPAYEPGTSGFFLWVGFVGVHHHGR